MLRASSFMGFRGLATSLSFDRVWQVKGLPDCGNLNLNSVAIHHKKHLKLNNSPTAAGKIWDSK